MSAAAFTGSAGWRRTLAIARQEMLLRTRNPLFWGLLVFAAFATLTINPAAMIPSGDAAIGGVEPYGNSMHALAQVLALTGLLFYTFFASILAGMAVPDDDEARIGDLLHSTPLTAGEYLAGKLAGILATLAVVILLHLLFAAGWYEGAAHFGSGQVTGPFRLGNYLLPAALFLVPGVFFCAVTSFAAGVRTRSPMVVYAVPTAAFVVALGGLVPRPASAFDGILDPFFRLFDLWGARWLSETVFTAEKGTELYNHAPLPLDLSFLISRGIAFGLPLLALAAAWRHCNRVIRGLEVSRAAAPGRDRPEAAAAAGEPARETALSSRSLAALGMTALAPGSFGPLAATWRIARAELAQVRSQPGAYLFAAFALLLAWEHAGSARGVLDSAVIHTAGGLAVGQIEITTALGCLLLLFQLVEALDRAPRLRFDALLFSTPAPTAALLAGNQLAGLALVLGIFAGTTAVGLLVLLLQPAGTVELLPFLQILLLLAPTFLFWSSLIATIYTLFRSRYLTYVAGIFALAGTAALQLQGGMTWLLNWPLWGALRWSDLGAFQLDREPLLINRGVFLLAALVLQGIAIGLFPRPEPERRSLPRRSALRLAVLALPLLAAVLVLGRNIRLGPEGGPAEARAKEYWRLNATTWGETEPPTVTAVEVRVDLEPANREMRVDGFFDVVNDTAAPLDELPFTVGDGFRDLEWQLDGSPAPVEDRSGLHLLSPPRRIDPGGSVRVAFRYRARVPGGYSRNGGGASEFILPAGVLLTTLGLDFLPTPGFVAERGVGPDNRPEPAEPPLDLWRRELPPIAGNRQPFRSRMEIRVPDAYRVAAVGEKISERFAEGRRIEIWQSDYPLRFLCLAAGRWAERREGSTAVLYHPAHAYNVDEILSTLVAARRLYSELFYPYPFKELVLTEYPDLATRAQGFPTHIPFSEGMGFLTRSEPGSFGLPTLVTAHEAAHQWWAHLLTPGRGPGADVLLEGMAHYSTLLLLEELRGSAARRDFARHLETSYLENRRPESEKSLLRSTGGDSAAEQAVTHDKGAWVMWMLDRHLGRQRMSAGLHQLIRTFEGQRDHPLLEDLLAALEPQAASPEAFTAFADQWLGRVVLPELVLREVRSSRSPTGWRIEAIAENIGSGIAEVELAARRGEPDGDAAAFFRETRQALSLAPGHPQAVALEVSFEPEELVFDPDVLLLQANRERARADLRAAEDGGDSR